MHSDKRQAASSPVRIKRAYEPYLPEDRQRVLVDRLWPRGLSKQDLADVVWLRDWRPAPICENDLVTSPNAGRNFVGAISRS